ncbi:hypothetical protein U5U50_01340 [Mycoplasma sp. 888]|nr:hypothetical protein [Mycoplasma sp. 888]WRQ26025.1 hypothetical protein U5U50_01340 [Mycoplasma sp. 888]
MKKFLLTLVAPMGVVTALNTIACNNTQPIKDTNNTPDNPNDNSNKG